MKPEFVKQWQYGSQLLTDWKIGSEIKFKTEWEGTIFEQWGKVLDIRQNELIKYSLFAPRPDLEDNPENYFVMSYILTAGNGQTKLEIIQEDNRPGAVQEAPQGEEHPILQGLKQIAETD
jgi:hypothetical protein